MRALLVDDTPEVPTTTASALSSEGFETVVVRLGREVPKMISSFEPDVLILDLSQPEINGSMIATLLRDNWPALPIILAVPVNGDVFLPTRTELLPRPYSIESLVEMVLRVTA